MHETILRTKLSIDECRNRLVNATAPWPSRGAIAVKGMFLVGQPHRVIMRGADQCFILALEKYGNVGLPFYRGIGFRLSCRLSEDAQDSGTRIVCRLNDFFAWRVLACLVFVSFAAFSSLSGTGQLKPGFWVIATGSILLGLVMPSFLEDGPDLVSFLKKTLNASELEFR